MASNEWPALPTRGHPPHQKEHAARHHQQQQQQQQRSGATAPVAASSAAAAGPKPKKRAVLSTLVPDSLDATRATQAAFASAAVFSAAAESSFATAAVAVGTAAATAAASPSTPGTIAAGSPSFSSPSAAAAGFGSDSRDAYLEQELLGGDHEYIYARLSHAAPAPAPSAHFSFADAGLSTPPSSSPSRSYAAVAFDGQGRDRCDFKSQVECRIFNLREAMRDEFATLLRTHKSSHNGFAASSSASGDASATTLEASMSRFLSGSHPANLFWFSLEIFVSDLLTKCWSVVEIESAGIKPAALSRMLALQVRLTQPTASTATGSNGFGERKQSGAGLPPSIAPSPHLSSRSISTPRRIPGSKVGGPPTMPRTTNNNNSNSSAVETPSARFPLHLSFAFGAASTSFASASLASLFPDSQEFFARFLMVAMENGRLMTHLKLALVMKIHQLADLSSQSSSSDGAWSFSESSVVKIARTWHGRILKLKLLAKFLSFACLLPNLDVSWMATLGGNQRGTADDGLPQFDPSAAMTNVVWASANAMNNTTFQPLTRAAPVTGGLGLTQPTPTFSFPLHQYLSYGRATESLSLFLPWVCAFLRVLKFDLVQLQMEYHQRVLQELADIYICTKRALKIRRESARALQLTSIQRTFSSPSLTSSAFTGLSPSPPDANKAPIRLPPSAFGEPSLTPLSTPSHSPPLTGHASVSRHMLSASMESPTFETDVTPPLSPHLDSSPHFSPHAAFGSGQGSPLIPMPTTSPSTSIAVVSSSLARMHSFLLLEIEELFEWLDLDVLAYSDAFDRRNKVEMANHPPPVRTHTVMPLSPILDTAEPTSAVAVAAEMPLQNRLVHPLVASPEVPAPVSRARPKNLIASFNSSATSTVVRPTPAVTAAVGALVSRSSSSVTARSLAVPSAASSSGPSLPTPSHSSCSLDSIPNLVPDILFLSLASSCSQVRKDEIRSIVGGDAFTLARPRKDSLALEGQPESAPPLKRTTSVLTRRKIVPTAGTTSTVATSDAESLAKLRKEFFRRHSDLSPIVRCISDSLERHIKDGHCTATLVAERCLAATREVDELEDERLRRIDATKDAPGLEQFIASLPALEQKLIKANVPTLVSSCLAAVVAYLESSALQALRALASPSLHADVVATAAHLAAQHSLVSLHAIVTEKVRVGVKVHIEKWGKKLRQLWSQKEKAWAEVAGARPVQLIQGAVAATNKSVASTDQAQASREIVIRVANASRCFQQLTSSHAANVHAPPIASACRSMLHVLMPLSICVAASHSTPTLAVQASLRPFEPHATPQNGPTSFFECALTALLAVHSRLTESQPIPNEYEQCWQRLALVYRTVAERGVRPTFAALLARADLPLAFTERLMKMQAMGEPAPAAQLST